MATGGSTSRSSLQVRLAESWRFNTAARCLCGLGLHDLGMFWLARCCCGLWRGWVDWWCRGLLRALERARRLSLCCSCAWLLGGSGQFRSQGDRVFASGALLGWGEGPMHRVATRVVHACDCLGGFIAHASCFARLAHAGACVSTLVFMRFALRAWRMRVMWVCSSCALRCASSARRC